MTLSVPGADELRAQMERALTAMRYQSRMGLGMRGLEPHHIEAVVDALMPVVFPLLDLARTAALLDCDCADLRIVGADPCIACRAADLIRRATTPSEG